MVLELKLRKIGNSVGLVLPKQVLSQLHVEEGDTLVITQSTDGGFRMTPHSDKFERSMKVFEDISRRYRNTLRELAK